MPASYPLALLVGSAANFATLVPSSPGYAGTFDGVVINVLQRRGRHRRRARRLAYDLVVHYATLFLPVVVVGTLVLWRSHMSFGQITHAPERVRRPWRPAANGRPPEFLSACGRRPRQAR